VGTLSGEDTDEEDDENQKVIPKLKDKGFKCGTKPI